MAAKVATPFSRAFIGGENDIRGFDFYRRYPHRVSVRTSSASVNQLNPDGSQRTQNALVGGVLTPVNAALPHPHVPDHFSRRRHAVGV